MYFLGFVPKELHFSGVNQEIYFFLVFYCQSILRNVPSQQGKKIHPKFHCPWASRLWFRYRRNPWRPGYSQIWTLLSKQIKELLPQNIPKLSNRFMGRTKFSCSCGPNIILYNVFVTVCIQARCQNLGGIMPPTCLLTWYIFSLKNTNFSISSKSI